MFGLSEATDIFQGSTERTWNCVLHYIQLIWSKLSQFGKPIMPKSRKRHHSRSRSKSRSLSRDRSRDRDDKHQKIDSYEKDRDGKRRKIDSNDSPLQKRSVSSDPECTPLPVSSDEEIDQKAVESENTMLKEAKDLEQKNGEETILEVKEEDPKKEVENIKDLEVSQCEEELNKSTTLDKDYVNEDMDTSQVSNNFDDSTERKGNDDETVMEVSTNEENSSKSPKTADDCKTDKNTSSQEENDDVILVLNDSTDAANTSKEQTTSSNVKKNLEITPKKVLSPRQKQNRLESEKKRQEKQREKEEREKKRNEEREMLKQEKLKKKEEKQKELEQKQKEKELKEAQKREEREKKEEMKRKEREEKEQKRKEKEEKEEQKKKEREMEKLKKLQEIEEKNKEKQKKEEINKKAAAVFANFFVSKKSDNAQEKKPDEANPSVFMAFEVKSDMRLPPPRRKPLSEKELIKFDTEFEQQNTSNNYLIELKLNKNIRSSSKTWPYQETLDDDVTIVEDGIHLGETICGDNSKLQKFRAKFLKFHENRRPAYYGTWRKKSKSITARKPLAEDNDIFNYEEDSDDDWEEEEQGESLNGSDDEDKENEEERDEYEVDNEFFVPHGHLSDDEIDDEEKARLSPESLKQKLKLLKDEFEQDIKSKTHKLKSRSIGCIWYNKAGSNVEEAIDRYLQPFAIIANGPIKIKKRSEIFVVTARKSKHSQELNPDYIPLFLKVIHGNPNKKTVLVEQFLTYMANKGIQIDLKKGTLIKLLKRFASWKQSKEKGSSKNKYLWLVNEDAEKKFNVDLVLPNFLENEAKK